MKKKGNSAEYAEQKVMELKRALGAAIRRRDLRTADDIFAAAAASEASRFWVGEKRAAEVVRLMLRGGSISYMKPQTQRMYREIYDRVVAMLETRPGMTVGEAVFEVVNGPAPEFYLTPRSARVILSRTHRSR